MTKEPEMIKSYTGMDELKTAMRNMPNQICREWDNKYCELSYCNRSGHIFLWEVGVDIK